MTEQKNKEVCLAPLAAGLVFPAVVAGEDFSLLYRNRAAQKLLCPPWRLRQFLKKAEREERERALTCAQLEGIWYFVCSFPPKKGERILVFLESLLPLCRPFSQSLLGESLEVMGELEEKGPFLMGSSRQVPDPAFTENFISRTGRLRNSMGMYRHFLSLEGRKMRPATVCSLSGVLSAVSAHLQRPRLQMEISCPERSAALVSPDALTFSVLNVIRFLYVYVGQESVAVQVTEKGRQVCMTFSFPDEENVFSALARVFCGSDGRKIFPKDICLAPLFSALLLCREHQMKMEMESRDGVGRIVLSLSSARMVPQAFLGTRSPGEERLLDEWIREIFFWHEKK